MGAYTKMSVRPVTVETENPKAVMIWVLDRGFALLSTVMTISEPLWNLSPRHMIKGQKFSLCLSTTFTRMTINLKELVPNLCTFFLVPLAIVCCIFVTMFLIVTSFRLPDLFWILSFIASGILNPFLAMLLVSSVVAYLILPRILDVVLPPEFLFTNLVTSIAAKAPLMVRSRNVLMANQAFSHDIDHITLLRTGQYVG